MNRHVTVQVPATTANLGPGFDCLGMALELHNTVELAIADTTTVEITGEGADRLPHDRSHLVLKVADYLAEQQGAAPPAGWHLVQHNDIPVARGLGSSSSAIVAGLLAANELLELGCDQEALFRCATHLEGHPDNVGPAVYGGLTVCCMAPGCLNCLSFAPPQGLRAVLAIPDFEVSTQLARKVLPQSIPHADGAFTVQHAAMTLAALIQGRFERLACAMDDRIHQPYRAHLIPGMTQAFEAALAAGAHGVALSGSGPTIVAFATEHTDAIATAMQDALAESAVRSRTLVVPASSAGAQVIAR